jgi:sugar/nucleoside kinase (ribokinase family)
MGGSVLYCGLTLARLGLRTGCLVGLDEEAREAGHEIELLESAGAAVLPAGLDRGPVFENLEEPHRPRSQRWISKSDAIPPAALPPTWRAARNWLLVPVSGEIGDEWAEVPNRDARVTLGLQGLLREFAAGGVVKKVPPRPSKLLERAGLVGLSVDDLPEEERAESLRDLTAAIIVATAGSDGGRALHGMRETRYRAFAADRTADPTGAGDVFLAALAAAWHAAGAPATKGALTYAAAAASCAVEELGLAGVPTREEVAERLRRG